MPKDDELQSLSGELLRLTQLQQEQMDCYRLGCLHHPMWQRHGQNYCDVHLLEYLRYMMAERLHVDITIRR